jgi:hypothetical protein
MTTICAVQTPHRCLPECCHALRLRAAYSSTPKQVGEISDGQSATNKPNSIKVGREKGHVVYVADSETEQVEWISALDTTVARLVKIIAGVDDAPPPTREGRGGGSNAALLQQAERDFAAAGMVAAGVTGTVSPPPRTTQASRRPRLTQCQWLSIHTAGMAAAVVAGTCTETSTGSAMAWARAQQSGALQASQVCARPMAAVTTGVPARDTEIMVAAGLRRCRRRSTYRIRTAASKQAVADSLRRIVLSSRLSMAVVGTKGNTIPGTCTSSLRCLTPSM